jgi:hypothetical protein
VGRSTTATTIRSFISISFFALLVLFLLVKAISFQARPGYSAPHQLRNCDRAVGDSFNTSGGPLSRGANFSETTLRHLGDLASAAA